MTSKQTSLRDLRGQAARYQKPATEREAAIVHAATRLFGQRGYEATHTADIAAEAGVTERTLFRYFPSKERLYRRVMFPALLAGAIPRALTDVGALFGTDAGSYAQWHQGVLAERLKAARDAAPQFRLLIAGLMSDEMIRGKVIDIWREGVLPPLVKTLRGFQERGELRADLRPELLARAVISLNLGYIFASALLAPEAGWNDKAEIEATVDLLLRGVAAPGK
jgi:TetR/AcrR family transcriptional regulator